MNKVTEKEASMIQFQGERCEGYKAMGMGEEFKPPKNNGKSLKFIKAPDSNPPEDSL